ncbi:MAG: GTP 3',8-cyclase MoaA [Chromatiaceae bacterium]|nr:GTP 3',8-cyclase MoaA [Chromatiaceae bacterium]
MATNLTAPRDPRLIDRFGRQVRYLRLSVTDRCDMRCLYCMAEDMTFLPRNQILTLEELVRLGRVFTELGVTKIRITGGEPLRRRNVMWLFEQLGRLQALKELVVTTNGSRLAELAQPLRDAGVSRINISLDTLLPERFRRITRLGSLEKTIAGVEAARAAGFKRLKLNTVVLRNMNHDEIEDLALFALERDMDISFIEEMPLGVIGDHDRAAVYFSSEEVLRSLGERFSLLPSTESTGGPSRYYRVSGYEGRIGLISPHSHNFCADCNRVRVTAEGRLLLCLGQEHSADLRRELRGYPDSDEHVRRAIVRAMSLKPRGHDFDLGVQPVIFRHMNMTGG